MKVKLLRNFTFFALLCIMLIGPAYVFAQGCPINIDFEKGDFTNWVCYRGTTSTNGVKNFINVGISAPTNGVHTIIPKSGQTDPYGKFPIAPPDGSKYAVKLGNDGTNGQAERISYTFTVPQTDFVLTYQYAVVLQDPSHAPPEQPRFTAKVLDISTNTYISCSSFDYVATSNIPGFKLSSFGGVIYKPWTPVTIDLSAYKGKKMLLEFTTADCTLGGHFGYAYVDVNRTCSSIINGNTYCANSSEVSLMGPAGYEKYTWYNADRSQILGTTNPLVIPPADGQQVILDMVPYAGFGCPSTLSTVLHKSTLGLTVTDPAPVCYPATVDITNAIKLDSDLASVSYWADAACTVSIIDPTKIPVSGTYYIQAFNLGCGSLTKPVNVVVNPLPVVKITDPATACSYATVDLSATAITNGSDAGLTYTYFKDSQGTVPLADFKNVKTAGVYYIKGTSAAGCSVIMPVNVTFYPPIDLVVTDPAPVCYPNTIDITAAQVTAGNTTTGTLTYWKDANATIPLLNPAAITDSGLYYIKLVDVNACQVIKPVNAIIHALPKLKITPPKDICLPYSADITLPAITAGSTDVNRLTYWKDAKTTIPLNNPASITDSGKYYIKAISVFGCESIDSVLVGIHKHPVLKITPPNGVYKPLTIDLTSRDIVAGSSPRLYYTYYTDSILTNKVTDPRRVDASGTYYIKAENIYGCDTSAAVKVVVAEIPDIKVPKAFTPGQSTNDRLYPFLIGIKSLKTFKVFNRWGNLVFQTTDASPGAGWDGNYNSKVYFMDTYTWVADAYDQLGNLVHRTGNTLILK